MAGSIRPLLALCVVDCISCMSLEKCRSLIDIDKVVAEEELVPLLTCDLYDCGNLNDFEFPLLSFREIIPSLGFMSVDCRNIVGKKKCREYENIGLGVLAGSSPFLELA